ncbi:RCC1 domain-containing protein [Streptosporangium soli]|nr:S8 family serine peptidase [Streptosporangium sp. KLBMP 9127]
MTAVLALAVGALSGALGAPLPVAAAPDPVHDHSKLKGIAPGTYGPLPAGFSTTELSVKFREERAVRLRGRSVVAADADEAATIRTVLAKYPGASIRPLSSLPEERVAREGTRLEERASRDLPDLNSWFRVTLSDGIEGLLRDLNALSSVEIAQAEPIPVEPVEPLQVHQRYRNPVGSAQGTGVDADYANAQPGGMGDGIKVTDIEAQPSVLAGNSSVGAFSAGADHSLMVAASNPSSGAVWAWGGNSQGQLGNGATTGSPVPLAVPGLTAVRYVSAGDAYSVVVKTDGTVWAWGDNSQGQLGNGTTTDSPVPVQVPGITGAQWVSAGDDGHVLAVLSDGTVRAWGDNSQGQLGNGTTTDSPSPVTVPGLTGVSVTAGTAAAGSGHSVVVLADGTVRAWGDNGQGQLGDGSTTSSPSPVTVPGLSGVREVSGRGDHVLALLTDQTVRAWGDNDHGQLGNGSTTDSGSPIQVPGLTSVSGIAGGTRHSVATSTGSGGTVRAWGGNDQGQLGDGTTTGRTSPVSSTAAVLAAVAAGQAHTIGVSGARLHVWGGNGQGRLGDGSTTGRVSPVPLSMALNQWNLCHMDLAGRQGVGEPPVQTPSLFGDPCASDDEVSHGTAVAGVISAEEDNGAGLAGIAPNAALHLTGTAVPDTITYAATRSQPGDVILVEAALAPASANGKWYPYEYNSAVYDQIVLATAAGITVIEAAGNGGNDLDDPNDIYASTIMSRPDSGAIIVGAGSPPSPGGSNCQGTSPPAELTPTSTTTYGSRVDIQAYGRCVATLGIPGLQHLTPSETDPDKMYYDRFNGTSSASAIIAGVVAAFQGVATQADAPRTPAEVRQILKQTGTPQPTGDPRHIGPQPNLQTAINHLLNT